MTVILTVLAVSIVLAVYVAARLVARSWVSAGSSIDRIIAEVTATPATRCRRRGRGRHTGSTRWPRG